jgi:seryl-tRNA synthetase
MNILNSRASTLPHCDFPISDDGLLSPGPAETRLIHVLRSRFREMAVAAGAEERQFPTAIAEEILDRSEYFQSFPQCASAVNSPNKTGRYFLSPAVCYHCYQLLMNSAIAGDTLLTCEGRCFRAESTNDSHLWEFTMREVVFLGSSGFVRAQCDTWKQRIARWAAQLGLTVNLAPAKDPFFVGETRGKKLLQQIKALKYELTMPGLLGTDVPVASFNLHERFFTSRFEVTLTGGAPAYSGCVAFGIERWCMALMAQHGVNAALRRVEESDDLR